MCRSEEFLVTDCHSRGFLFFPTQPLRPSVHVRQLLKLHSRPLIHSIYIPPFPSSIPTSNVFRLVVRFFSHCMCSCVYLCDWQSSWRHPCPVPTTTTTYLSPAIYSRTSSRSGVHSPPCIGLQRGGSYFRLGSIRTWEEHQKKKQVMPSETSHPISFVMKRLVELTMTNGRRLVRLFFKNNWHKIPGPPPPPDFGIIHKINRRTRAVFVL